MPSRIPGIPSHPTLAPPLPTCGPKLQCRGARAHDGADDLKQAQAHQSQQQRVALGGLQVLSQAAELLRW